MDLYATTLFIVNLKFKLTTHLIFYLATRKETLGKDIREQNILSVVGAQQTHIL